MEVEGGRSVRSSAVLFLVVVFMAAGRTASGHGGGGGEAGQEQFLKLWTDGGGDHLELWGEVEEYEEEEDGYAMAVGKGCRPPTGRNVVNVDSFGAAGDGDADDTEAFQEAWKKACSLSNAVFLVPGGRRYKVAASSFMGPCKEKMIIQIQGTIVAPEEPSEWDPKSQRLWLLFSGLAGARIQGSGVIDGSGSKWWANSCKIDKSKPCRAAPTAVTIDSCSGVRVKSLRIQNAQQMHLTVSRSRGVRVAGVRISSPEDSPNTDGIHVAASSGVAIQNCRIGTGDDCISISNGSFGVRMRGIECGPGHGISIGSLGQGGSFAAVEGVVLDGARITGATNGVRIKTWQGGAGYVRNVRFANVRVEDVDHPIIIDQFYCDSKNPCRNQTTNVQVSNVVYENISGTSRQAEAIKFACSDAVPCSDIVLTNIDLHRDDGADVQTICNCAMGFDYGPVRPAADCLRSSVCPGGGGGAVDHDDDDADAAAEIEREQEVEPEPSPPLHTEL